MVESTPVSIPTVEVKLRRPTVLNTLRKIFFFTLSMLLMLTAAVMILSIVFLFPGLGLGILAVFILFFSFDPYVAACPMCQKKNGLLKNKEDFKCKRCSTPVIVKWLK